ncbi:MAG: hypothetical protein FJX74_24235, partial [Armatimonadetes bacterium]|nr:hypothetical protein [Armatimonadota bacterium]
MVERRLPLRAATALAVAAAALPVGVGLSQTVPLPGAATDDEKALALRTALEAAGLPADTVPRMVKSNGRVSDPRTIGVYLTAPDAELGGRTADLIVEVRFEPRLHVHRISWHGRGGNRAVEPTPASDAYAQARAYAAQRCEFWNERHAVLVRAAVWDGDPGQRPVCDAEFTWEIESSGLASGECYVGLNGSPLLPTLYQTYMNPF